LRMQKIVKQDIVFCPQPKKTEYTGGAEVARKSRRGKRSLLSTQGVAFLCKTGRTKKKRVELF